MYVEVVDVALLCTWMPDLAHMLVYLRAFGGWFGVVMGKVEVVL